MSSEFRQQGTWKWNMRSTVWERQHIGIFGNNFFPIVWHCVSLKFFIQFSRKLFQLKWSLIHDAFFFVFEVIDSFFLFLHDAFNSTISSQDSVSLVCWNLSSTSPTLHAKLSSISCFEYVKFHILCTQAWVKLLLSFYSSHQFRIVFKNPADSDKRLVTSP